MITAVLFGFLAAAFAPALYRWVGPRLGLLMACVPAGLFVYLLSHLPAVLRGRSPEQTLSWVPSLGSTLALRLDGLGLLMGLLITGVGVLVMVYAGAYLRGHAQLGRFYLYLTAFMAAMLGIALADDVLTLFVFWELTSLTSYLLIGFQHDEESSRRSALSALLVTGGGGLALLAGLVLLSDAGDSARISVLLTRGELIRAHAAYPAILALVALGAFTKSAQWPFHFWLPAAMAAPTPVSAYLHSATMVKAGVFLLARMAPALGGTTLWQDLLVTTGLLTLLAGAVLAFGQHDLKRLLAYSTVAALGALVLLIGLDTPFALGAAVVFLVAHALYKGALFLVAGVLDHETGTRDVRRLFGLHGKMPFTSAAAFLAGASMAGLPPFVGFLGKELLFEGTLAFGRGLSLLLTLAAGFGLALVLAVAGVVVLRPFLGRAPEALEATHEAPPGLWLPPLALAITGALLGAVLTTHSAVSELLAAAARSAAPGFAGFELHLWHGFTPVLGASVLTLVSGVTLFFLRDRVLRFSGLLRVFRGLGPARLYERLLEALTRVASVQTAVLQTGYLRHYVLIVVLTVLGLAGGVSIARLDAGSLRLSLDARIDELVLAGLVLAAAVVVVRARSRLTAVAALGVIGYGVALFFLLFAAPDLAMTQFAIESLSVILFVFVLYRLPRFSVFSSRIARSRDLLVSLAVGVFMSALLLFATSAPLLSRVSPYFAEMSWPEAKGRNVVNVILVDFRALDTLGEITVLAVAAIGVYALLRLRSKTEESA